MAVGGSGTLTGVTSITSNFGDDGFCAVLTSDGVVCWGSGYYGQLGNGELYTSSPTGSAVPVPVEGTGGAGNLTDVASVTSGPGGYCALLTSGQVVCWGAGTYGDLGDGTDETSAVPVTVEGVGGAGTLSNVASVYAGGGAGYCALLLISGGLDCWGYNQRGTLGNGQYANSAFPVSVDGVGGTGTLSGVVGITDDVVGYCALIASGKMDCWGTGNRGELGDGQFHPGNTGVPVPVAVKDLGKVALTAGSLDDISESYCVVSVSTQVRCWGADKFGNLGDGKFVYTDLPVTVVTTSGSGALSGVASLTSDGNGHCALLTDGRVDCWGSGNYGQLGNGVVYNTGEEASSVPVAVT